MNTNIQGDFQICISVPLTMDLQQGIEAREYLWRSISFQKQSTEVFCKKGVLKHFAKFTGKHLCQSLFSNKVAALRLVYLLKNRLWYRYFPVNSAKFSRTPFSKEHLWLLFLFKFPAIFDLQSRKQLLNYVDIRGHFLNDNKSIKNCKVFRFNSK